MVVMPFTQQEEECFCYCVDFYFWLNLYGLVELEMENVKTA